MVTLLIIALPLVVAAFILRPRNLARERPSATVAVSPNLSDQAMLDSLDAADARRDWVAALLWAERLGARRPRDHGVLLARGTAWSNYAVDQRAGRVNPRPALRTSLERMACMRRAVGLMDSSSRAANTDARWLDAGTRLARLYETLGLPGDALIAHETIKQRLPGELIPALRAYWLRALLYDPVNPDTSEYHQRMKSLGLR